MEHNYQNLALLVMSGPAQGEKIQLDRPILLGRDTRSRIMFNDERVSRHHALIDLVDTKPVLRDLGSKNGTFVNGSEIKDYHFLKVNDRVRLGKTQMVVVSLAYGPPRSSDVGAPETSPDGAVHTDDEFLPEHLQINRRLLRQATELTSRLGAFLKTRHPLSAVMGAIRKEFLADGAAVFRAETPLHPLYTEGELLLNEKLVQQLEHSLATHTRLNALLLGGDGVEIESKGKLESGEIIVFPVRVAEAASFLIVLRRDSSRPFAREQLQFAEALAECLRILPLADSFNKGAVGLESDSMSMIVGSSDVMNKVRDQLRSYANTSATVLVVGESGTGKELCARAIWQLSDRRFAPYVEVNSACMLPELMESELFGHEKGAFTGASERNLGKLEIADGGTVFLDEIGELPIDLQAKLLRVLEGQPFYRVGGRELIHTNLRFVCATNRNLEEMVENGTFRRDLFHRINILRMDLPPLRNRLEDIPELVTFLMSQIQEDFGTGQEYTLTPRAYRILLSHNWPGNVRELRNVLQRMMLLSNGSMIDEKMIPPEIGASHESTTMKLPRLQVLTEMMEREEITKALLEGKGQKSHAARLLGISRPTLDKKIKFYGLQGLVGKGKDDPESEDFVE